VPLQLGRDDLVLSHFSLPRTTPLEDRARAAAGAGFAGIGWYVADYARLVAEGWRGDRIAALLRDHGLVLHEVDALPLDRLGHLDAAVELACLVGAHHVQVQGDRPGTVAEAAGVIATLADRLAPYGIEVAIEFVGDKNIATAADAWELVELAARPNVGVQVDVWHHVRGANDWAMLEALPVERITSVQLDDGPITPVYEDYTEDTVRSRCVPGAGEFDLVRFVRTVHPPTCPLPLSLEVIDDDLLALGVDEAARRIADATRAFLAGPDLRGP
jgi:sugar phosphate isomerase/epimerase